MHNVPYVIHTFPFLSCRYRLLRHFNSIYVERSIGVKVTSLVSQSLQETVTSQASNDSPASDAKAITYSANLAIDAHNCSEVRYCRFFILLRF